MRTHRHGLIVVAIDIEGGQRPDRPTRLATCALVATHGGHSDIHASGGEALGAGTLHQHLLRN